MIKAVIVDDDPQLRKMIASLISENFTQISITGTADSVEQGIRLIHSVMPDLVFLDVEMPDGNGFNVLQQTKNLGFKTIFVTGHEAYAIKAIKFGALNYILKPINEFEFIDAVQDAIENLKTTQSVQQIETTLDFLVSKDQNKRIVLRTTQNIFLTEVKDIMYCKSDNTYTTFYFSNKSEILVSRTMKEYEELLSPLGFFRPHTSYLVNINYVTKIDKSDGYFIILKNGKEIPVSARRKNAIKQILG